MNFIEHLGFWAKSNRINTNTVNFCLQASLIVTVKIAFCPSLSKTEKLTRFRVPSLGLPTVHSKLVTSKLTASVKLPSNLSETHAFKSCVGYFQANKGFEGVRYHVLDTQMHFWSVLYPS